MELSQFDLEFTKSGNVFDEAQLDAILAAVPAATDLIVLSHGWNNNVAEANELYDALLANMAAVFDDVAGLGGRTFQVVRIFWPSKRFEDADLIPGGGAASVAAREDATLARLLQSLKHDPDRLGDDSEDPVRAATVAQIEALVPALGTDPAARREFVLLLRAMLDPAEAEADDASEDFFSIDPEQIFKGLRDPVLAPSAPGSGGGSSLRSGGAASLGDVTSGLAAAARRIANFATYYAMKQRAGVVGRTGLAPVLRRIRDHNRKVHIHLVGHSFGGRLVTSAAHALPPATEHVSLTLLQAAFSHNALSDDYGHGKAGAFRSLIAERRISGPIAITHTKNDKAVGIAYPLASRIARDAAAALGDRNDPYGGMGRNGAQHTPEVAQPGGGLEEVGGGYDFAPGKIYNLQADRFIADHGAVTGQQVAYALLHVVAAT